MGFLKDIANQPKLQSFPNSTFLITGDVPKAQCTEALIQADDAHTTRFPDDELHDPGAFVGFNLAGKVCTITANPGGNTGDFDITANTDDVLSLWQAPGNGTPTSYYVHDGAALEITRNVQSFANFIAAAGYAYTIKGGKLYTNIPSAQLQPACSITFDPLT